MSEHLAECPKFALRYTVSRCICDALSRCERRVRFSLAQEGAMETGWKAGLNAAREHIMGLPYEIDGEIWIDRDEVIGWIDELRGDK